MATGRKRRCRSEREELMRALITGAGIVGTETAKILCDRGDAVVLLDNDPDEAAVHRIVGPGRCTIERADVADHGAVDGILRRHKITDIVHTAAVLTRAARERPADAVRVNVAGTVNILEALRSGQVRRAVLASSTTIAYATFGRAAEIPVPEDFALRVLSERPASMYATTKLAAELIAMAYRDSYDAMPIVLRYSAVIGAWPNGRLGVPAKLIKVLVDAGASGQPAILDDPLILFTGVEEFVDARDAARANVAALDAASPKQGTYVIAAAELATLDDIIGYVREIYPGLTVRFAVEPTGGFAGFPYARPGASDTRATETELGFKAKYRLRDSIGRIADVFRDWRNAA
jgi:UDP-glucose 4-epimerase